MNKSLMILETLQSDHDRIDEVLEKIELSRDRSEKMRLIRKLSVLVSTHFKVEESGLFNFLEGIPELRSLVFSLYDQHTEVSDLLAETSSGVGQTQAQFDAKVEDLIDVVLDLLDTEEVELFSKMEGYLTDEELTALGAKLNSSRKWAQAA